DLMLDAFDLREHLFHRHGNDVLDLSCARAGERHEHVRERHVDLRLFLPRRDEHGEEPEQEACDRKERRQLRVLKPFRDGSGEAEPPLPPSGMVRRRVHRFSSAPCRSFTWMPAATGSSATSSPASSPARISTSSPYCRPMRTCRSITRSSPTT